MIINQANIAAMFAGFKTLFNVAFSGTPSALDQIAMTVPSQAREENYAWLGAFPGFREWAGPRVLQNLSLHSHTIKNRSFENTISVPREDLEDDQVGVFAPMFSELGRGAKLHPDELLFGLIKDGFAVTCYDGQNFFDTDHPVGDGAQGPVAAVSNMQAGAGAAWFLLDTSRAIKPFIFQKRRDYNLVRKDDERDDNVFLNKEFVYGIDARVNVGVGLWQLAFASKAALSAANYAAARAAMMSVKTDTGRPLGVTPTLLIAPPSLESDALKLLNSEHAAGGETNEWKGTAKLIVTPYLA
jgi:phage major head subunit gpT-like protein